MQKWNKNGEGVKGGWVKNQQKHALWNATM